MPATGYPFTCVKCGFTERRSGTVDPVPCRQCGEMEFNVVIEVIEQDLTLLEEFDAIGMNPQGQTVSERLIRTDGNIEASFASDSGRASTLSATQKERIEGFEEEGIAAQALAKAFNARYSTNYSVQAKMKDDYDYADRVLESQFDDPKTINIQIRHLDTDVIAKLGKSNAFDVKRTTNDLVESINMAIAAKANVDPNLKPRTLLLLQIPSPLGKLERKEIQRWSFDLKGFKGVWVAPFREDNFEVFGPLNHDDIAIEAYHLWDQEDQPSGRDKEHWYSAIDNLRRL